MMAKIRLALKPRRSWLRVSAGVFLASLTLQLPWASVLASRRYQKDTRIFGTVKIVGEQGKEVPPPPETVIEVLQRGRNKKITGAKIKSVKGDYEISGISPGTYNLVAHNGGSYSRQELRNQKIVAGDNPVNFVLTHVTAELGRIDGVATTPEGKVLVETRVGLYLPDCDDCPVEQTITNAVGAYSLHAAPNNYRVAIVSKKSDGTETLAFLAEPIRIVSAESIALNLKLEWRGEEPWVLGHVPERPSPLQLQELAITTSIGSSISGRITFSGGAVPNVIVTVSRDGRTQTATTNMNGDYRFLNLEPGSYTVAGEASSTFKGFTQPGVQVSLSTPAVVNVQLPPSGSMEVAQMTVDDVTTNPSGINVSTEQFSNFPTQRTVQSLYSIAPTVARSGLRDASGRDRNPSVGGSSGSENNYILDGVSTTDPAFGGSGANLPFEFVQEIEIKTGAYGAEHATSTGGIFNVITKSGSNEFRGDAFGYFTTKGLVRETKQFPFTGSAPDGFSEIDAGFDIGGPIAKDKLWFFGAFNPQQRKNFFLTQTFHAPVENKITTPFYSGKITWGINTNNTFTISTFGDFTKQEGFLFGNSGFGSDPGSFRGEIQTGGHNYAARLNSTITPTWIGEFSGGLHYQRANTLPEQGTGIKLVSDNFAVLRGGSVLNITQTATNFVAGGVNFGPLAFVDGRGGTLQRNYVRQGFGLYRDQDRNSMEFAARLQNIWGRHTFKYGFEWARNDYKIATLSTGPTQTFTNPNNLPFVSPSDSLGILTVNGSRVTNLMLVCTTRTSTIVCGSNAGRDRALALIAGGGAPAGLTTAITGAITEAEFNNNPFLIFNAARVRDFELVADTYTNTEGFYIQDDFKLTRNVQLNLGLRWDYQQAYGNDGSYLKLNSFMDNMQPRAGLIWDFTGRGKGKLFINYARFLETPIPLDINVRAGSDTSQIDKNFNVSLPGAPNGAFSTPLSGFAALNLGHAPTPVDKGLEPQTVNEVAAGFEYEIGKDLALGFRGVYRAQGTVIEDGSFDDGNTYFIFNPGEIRQGDLTREELACNDPLIGCFGRARRYYRALEFTATKRFSNNYQFIASYVYSSLIGNYEGPFRIDNGQFDSNFTSLFDFVSLLQGTYGRLPHDRPHQLKFNGSYRFPFKLLLSGTFYAQSGSPFNALVPHPIYGDNKGFCIPGLSCVRRGTAINPLTGNNRTPTIYNLDLGAYYPIQFGENRQLRFQVDWFNVLNTQRAVRQDETFLINTGATGIPPVPNPFWGTGTNFQFPSSLRLGAKLTF